MDRLLPGQSLQRNQKLISRNGEYELSYLDGGFALIRVSDGSVRMRAKGAKSAKFLTMQEDGNLVLFAQVSLSRGTGSGLPLPIEKNGLHTPVWMSGTAGNAGAYAQVSNSGQLLIRLVTIGPNQQRGPRRSIVIWKQPVLIF